MTRATHTRHSGRLVLALAALSLAACTRQHPVFKLLTADQTGVTFANTITTTDSLNAQSDPYVYNGAGVAVGDVNNDGLPDLFFAGNQVSSRLYLNKGRMRFEDVTERAGVKTSRWATGVTMVDINNDGWLDIYVSVSGPKWSKAADRANLLFVNNRDGTFTEEAAKYGIADTGFTTHAAFLDYDGDGCLDLFLLENSPEDFSRGDMAPGAAGKPLGSFNQLYHNDCHGKFTNVSKQAGLEKDAGYGLGVAVADFNGDGRPDIYVSSDIEPNDMLFVNDGDGTFTNKSRQWLRHTSFAGMGIDVADFNNDGLPDILQVDMMPAALNARKKMSGFRTWNDVMAARSTGRRMDYDANALQLNDGPTGNGDVTFSEIGRMAGVAYTDWSWSALFADFDDDGNKDIFITNGYPKAVNDFDYVMAFYRAQRAGDNWTALKILRDLQSYKVPSYVFRNDGDLTFTDVSKAWGIDQPGFSYGAAYADLNNDGRLDLVVNNIDAPASIYENVRPADDAHHWLEVRLRGDTPNSRGIGAKLVATTGARKQYLYHSPYRGYMSTMDEREHFGLGRATRVDTLEVIWPNGARQVLTGLGVDRQVIVSQSDARQRVSADPPPAHREFEALDAHHRPAYLHDPGMLADFTVEPILPYMLSAHGPPLAVADVNGDGLEDVFVGGGAGVPGRLFLQQKDGSFVESTQGQPWEADKAFDDWGALFFDANGDGLPDLYVSSCDFQLVPGSSLLQDRLYINEGHGRFVRDTTALPSMRTCTGTIRAGDFTGHGRQDLFVAGRMTSRKYPYPTRSYLLRNDGGHFTDVTAQYAPELADPGGMITDAAFVDFDGDGRLDLVTVGEWMPVQFFRNEGSRFRNVTAATHLPPMRGWWYSLAVGDFDHDGRPDLVVGNLGLNHTYTTSTDSPFGVYAGDFNASDATAIGPGGEQTTDVVFTTQVDGKEYPIASRATLGPAIYSLALRYPTYGSFAEASMAQAFGEDVLKRALHYQADTFASMYLHNDGVGRFTATPLPRLAQISPIRGIVAHDVDGDGNLDLIVAGNIYETEPNTPRADAGNGLWLRGDGHGHFTPVPPAASGFLAPLDVSGLALIHTPTGLAVLVANTGDSLQAFGVRKR